MNVSFEVFGQPGSWQGELDYLPQKDTRVKFDKAYFTVHESYLNLKVYSDGVGELESQGFVILKPTDTPAPIGPGSVTKTDFQRMRSFISRYGRSQFELAHAGAQMPEDADAIRKDAEQARKEVYAELLRLEKGLGL